ncbi:MAG: phosphotransferase family protein [Acidobacteria bacterium]|nr:phosphotransferase family protein [Acidobacteriota bacterium]
MTDRASDFRPGESLDTQKLGFFLRPYCNLVSVKQFPSGFSNLTYLLICDEGEYVLRRPPFGANIKSAHDMGREYRVINDLHQLGAKVPAPLVYCEDEQVLGAPFYVMERVKGVILRNRVPNGVTVPFDPLSRSFVATLSDLHKLDMSQTALMAQSHPQGYVKRQIDGWTKRYRKAQTDEIRTLDTVIEWLAEDPPNESSISLIHNDFKYDNLVLSPTDLSEVRAVLDWEMATIGCPLMDLGTSLGYWAEEHDPPALKHYGLTWVQGNMTRRELVDAYQLESGREVKNPVFYLAYGLFKVAVIAQQIYARFKAGHTSDPRFGQLIHVIHACGELAVRAMDRQKI